MSDSPRLGIQITAQDNATAKIKETQREIQSLQNAITAMGGTAATINKTIADSFQAEITALKGVLSGLEAAARAQRDAASAAKNTTNAINEQTSAWERAAVAAAKLREINRQLAEEGAQYKLNTANNKLEERAEAQAYANGRKLAELENAGYIAAKKEMRRNAEAENANLNYINSGTRMSAEAENANHNARMANLRAEAELENANANIKLDNARKLAAIENESRNAQMRTMRGEAGSDNAAFDRTAAFEESAVAAQQLRQAEADAAVEAERFKQITRELAAEEKAEADAAREAARVKKSQEAENARGHGVGGTRMMRHGVALMDEGFRGQRGAMFSTLGAAARDAGLGVGALASSMGALVAVMGGEAILRSAEAMGKWAVQMRAGAAATGMSVQQFSMVTGAMENLGLKGEAADRSMRHLATSMAEAVSDPASKTAQAFHNVGISQEAIVGTGGDVYKMLRLAADAFQQTADSANKTENFTKIFGMGLQQIIPLIQDGSSSLDELTEKVKENGHAINDEQAEALKNMNTRIHEAMESITGGGVQAMVSWAGAIAGATEAIAGLVNMVTSFISKIGNMDAALARWTTVSLDRNAPTGYDVDPITGLDVSGMNGPRAQANRGKAVDGALGTYGPSQPKRDVAALTGGGGGSGASAAARHDATMAAMDAANNGGNRQAQTQAEINSLRQTLASATLTGKERESLETELAQKTISLDNEVASANAAAARKAQSEATKAAKQSYEDFAASERQKIAEANGSSSEIGAIYKQWMDEAQNRFKQHAATIAQINKDMINAVNKAKIDALKDEGASDKSAASNAILDQQLSRVKNGMIRPQGDQSAAQLAEASQKYSQLAQQTATTADIQIAKFQQIADASAEGSSAQKEALAQVASITQQSKQEEISLYKQAGEAAEQAAKKAAASYVSFFDGLGGAMENFGSTLTKALLDPQREIIHQGLTTTTHNLRGQEISRALASMLMSGINSAQHLVASALSKMLASAISGGATNSLSTLLGNMLSKAVGSIGGSAASSAVGNAIGSGASSAAGSGAVVTAIGTAATATSTAVSGAVTASGVSITSAIGALGVTLVGAITGGATSEDALLTGINLKPSILGNSYSQGGIVPSAAGGMVVGNRGTLSVLHEQEMVLPKHLSNGIQTMINNGGARNANLNFSPTVNMGNRSRSGTGMSRAEFAQMMSQHSGAMFGEARNLVRSGFRG